MKKCFTLVELMVVLVIIGIIVALVIPNTIRAIRVANTKGCANNIRTLESSIQMFYSENRTWPANTAALIPFLSDSDGDGALTAADVPTCPITNGAYALAADADGNNSLINRVGHFDAPGPFPDVHN